MNAKKPVAVFLKGDPELSFKRKAWEFLERTVIVKDEKKSVSRFAECELLDLSSFSKIPMGPFLNLAPSAERILLSPTVLADPKTRGLAERFRNKIVVSRPLRAWGIVEKIKSFMKANLGGELTSFRIIWNLPKSRSHTEREFVQRVLPDFLDLSRFISERKIVRIQLEKCAPNAVFGLVVLEDNVVCELDIHEAGPKSLDPVRFVHAYFQKGVVSNMPVFGLENTEGMLYADDKKREVRVAEHGDWEGGDEIEDLYLRMASGILDGSFVSPMNGFVLADRDTCVEAWRSGEPTALGGKK